MKSWIVKAIHSIRINTNEHHDCENNNTYTSSRYLESALQIASSLTNQIVQADEKCPQTGEDAELLLPPVSVGRDWATYVTVQLKNVVQCDLEQSEAIDVVSSLPSHGGNGNDWVNTHEENETTAAVAILACSTFAPIVDTDFRSDRDST